MTVRTDKNRQHWRPSRTRPSQATS
ncbi:hypothetical protein [Streptomyces werraensis]